jgi:hypothetical protein
LGLIGPACEQPEYNMFTRHKVEQEFQPLYERCASPAADVWSGAGRALNTAAAACVGGWRSDGLAQFEKAAII